MQPTRFGFKVRLQGAPWGDLLDLWRAADQSDVFVSGWTYDHLAALRNDGDVIAIDRDEAALDGWTVLSAVASVTERLRLGTLVTGIHFRHPVVLAKMATTLDVISGGRLELGLGAGWLDEECDVFGLEPLGTPAERIGRLGEAIDVLVGLMTQDRFSYHGERYVLREASCRPHPLQRPHPPLWIGGNGARRTLPLVAARAQAWNYTSLRPGVRQKRRLLKDECRRIGRSFTELVTSVQLAPGSDLSSFRDNVDAWVAAGADYVIVALPLPHHARLVESLDEALRPLAAPAAAGPGPLTPGRVQPYSK
jgi:alkanesulfonate monooxygenase SsuD/methylene tetrahydromethanopterin reductase-like flavin-dependent oxidoreductase (luciferase family)